MALITEVPGTRDDYKVWFSGDGRDGVYVIAKPDAGLTFEEGQRSAVPLKEGEKITFLGSGERGKVEGDQLVIEGGEPAKMSLDDALVKARDWAEARYAAAPIGSQEDANSLITWLNLRDECRRRGIGQ